MGKVVNNIPFRTEIKKPIRGDVFYADLTGIEQVVGSEQTGNRPVIIIQNDIGNMHSTTTVVAVITTNTKKSYPMHVVFHNIKVLPQKSAICLEQIKTIDKARLENYCGNVGEKVLQDVDKAIEISLGMRQEKKPTEKGDDGVMRMVKKETVYDEQSNDWMLLAEKQLEFFTNIKQYIVNLKCDKDQMDKEIEDILEYMEPTNYNVAQGYKVYKLLRDKRVLRKEILKEIEMLEVLTANFDCEEMRKSYQSSVAKMQNTFQTKASAKANQELMKLVV